MLEALRREALSSESGLQNFSNLKKKGSGPLFLKGKGQFLRKGGLLYVLRYLVTFFGCHCERIVAIS